jgi:hypothetical protein
MVDSSERSHSGTSPIPSLLSAMLRASDGILELLQPSCRRDKLRYR